MSNFNAKIQDFEKHLENIATFTIKEALKQGASEAEISLGGVTGLNVSSRDCDIENIEFNRDNGMDITVYCNKRRGSASTTDLSENALKQCVNSAINIASFADKDPDCGLCDKDLQCTEFFDLDILFEPDCEPEIAASRAVELEKKAVSLLPLGIKASDGASYSSSVYTNVLANSHDFCHAKSASSFYKGLTFLGESNGHMERGSGYSIARSKEDLFDDDKVIKEALEQTLGKLNPKSVPTGTYNVIFTKGAAVSLWQSLVNAIAGGALYRKSSFLCDSLNQQILPEYVSIKEDPFLKKAFGSASYDNEGVAVRPMSIIENGVLKEYLLSTYSAKKLNMRSNGHCGGIYNWFIDFGTQQVSFEQMLADTSEGLVIDSLMGQGVDLISGNYSRGASGYYFKNGKRIHAVSEITIAGNLKDMFANLKAMADDIDPRFKIKTGSILLPKMTVSGV
ncbi:MAG: metalloprotease PmbA [Succinatimonas sp.]|nr:metalloprotease PmbA [Succinatimonas sp.]